MQYYVLVIHGIGTQEMGYSKPFEELVRQVFEKESRRKNSSLSSANSLVWKELYWAEITQQDQDVLKKRMKLKGLLRKFAVTYLGDAIAYSRLTYPPDKYSEIQSRFAQTIRQLSEQAERSPEKQASLTIISHSLGTVIASDGIYELCNKGTFPKNLSLDNFFTLGSPIALYGLRYGIENFNKPIRPKVWINIYYPQDGIGYPLKVLNTAYNEAVVEDIRLIPGGGPNWLISLLHFLIGWLPFIGIQSHSWYLTDRRVIRKIVRSILGSNSNPV